MFNFKWPVFADSKEVLMNQAQEVVVSDESSDEAPALPREVQDLQSPVAASQPTIPEPTQ